MAIKIKIKNVLTQKELERYFGSASKNENNTYRTSGKVTIKRGSNKSSK